ncbi:MAG: DUF1003 domain-containing protein [Patescibacteria group bacterium]
MSTLAELKKQRKPIRNVNVKHEESLTPPEKFAVWITDRIGTTGFFFIILIWTVFWILWNIFAPMELIFDPLPAFVLWVFISNMLQLFFLPLIMISQNLQERHAIFRAENDFEVNLKAEREIEAILINLEKQEESIAKILEKIR